MGLNGMGPLTRGFFFNNYIGKIFGDFQQFETTHRQTMIFLKIYYFL